MATRDEVLHQLFTEIVAAMPVDHSQAIPAKELATKLRGNDKVAPLAWAQFWELLDAQEEQPIDLLQVVNIINRAEERRADVETEQLRLRAIQLFDAADADGNGWLSKNELKKSIQSDDNLRVEFKNFGGWQALWKGLDQGGSGKDGHIVADDVVKYLVDKRETGSLAVMEAFVEMVKKQTGGKVVADTPVKKSSKKTSTSTATSVTSTPVSATKRTVTKTTVTKTVRSTRTSPTKSFQLAHSHTDAGDCPRCAIIKGKIDNLQSGLASQIKEAQERVLQLTCAVATKSGVVGTGWYIGNGWVLASLEMTSERAGAQLALKFDFNAGSATFAFPAKLRPTFTFDTQQTSPEATIIMVNLRAKDMVTSSASDAENEFLDILTAAATRRQLDFAPEYNSVTSGMPVFSVSALSGKPKLEAGGVLLRSNTVRSNGQILSTVVVDCGDACVPGSLVGVEDGFKFDVFGVVTPFIDSPPKTITQGLFKGSTCLHARDTVLAPVRRCITAWEGVNRNFGGSFQQAQKALGALDETLQNTRMTLTVPVGAPAGWKIADDSRLKLTA